MWKSQSKDTWISKMDVCKVYNNKKVNLLRGGTKRHPQKTEEYFLAFPRKAKISKWCSSTIESQWPHTCFIFFVPWHLVGRVPLNHTALDGWWVALPDNLSLRIDPQNWRRDDEQLSDGLEQNGDFLRTRYLPGEALVLIFFLHGDFSAKVQ